MTEIRTEDKQLNVFSITWPIFIETLLFMMLGSVDTFMLSHYSDNAVAAVGVSNQLLSMVNIMFGIVSGGTAIIVAQYLGAGDKKMASKATSVAIAFNFCFGMLLSLAMAFAGKTLLSLMNIRPELMGYSVQFLSIVGGFMFIQAVMMAITAVVRSNGYTRISMFVTLGMNALNLFGDYCFIFGPFGMPVLGVRGVAISTTVSKLLGLIFMIVVLKKVVDKKFTLRNLKPFPTEILVNLLKIGIPTAGEQLSYNSSQLVITYFINMLSNEALTTKSYVQNIVMFAYLFSVAVGQGTQIVVGHLVGKGDKETASSQCMKSLRLAIIVSLSISLIFVLTGKSLLSIFTTNKDIISIDSLLLIVDLFLEPGRATNLVVINSLRAAGDVRFPVYMGILSMWGVSVTLSYFFGIILGYGIVGMWVAFAMDEWLRGIIMIFRWKGRKWENMAFVKA